MKKILCLAIASLVFFFPALVSASTEFNTNLENIQTIDKSGKTHVQKNFVLTNNLSTVYVKKYGVEVSSDKITNVKVHNGEVRYRANVVHNDTSTTIGIEFDDKVVGKGTQRKFTIEYDDPDAAVLSGNILEAYVPKIANPEEFDTYIAILKVPVEFGTPTIVSPEIFSASTENGFTVLTFTEKEKDHGISAIFGEKQFFDFALSYHLHNTTGNKGVAQIALPPDTQFQKVKYTDISPRPQSVHIDGDGNWIATYEIDPNQETLVIAKGIATIFLKPEVPIPVIEPKPEHIHDQPYWETTNPIIQTIATKHPSPQQIFDFVVDSLEYNYERLSSKSNRYGALKSLENSQDAVCQEYTDLFVTIARANNIPARQATGYAFTNNEQIRPLSLVKDVLHAWPEYYDEAKKVWIPVDPTWASTTGGVDYFSHLDFSHFVFAYQGISSEKPYPAGAYKIEETEDKDVNVNVTSKDIDIQKELTISIKKPGNSFFGLVGIHTLEITNQTGVAWYNLPLNLAVPNQYTVYISDSEIERILPYQTIEIPFHIFGTQWIGNQETTLQLNVDGETSTHQVVVSSRLHQMQMSEDFFMYAGIAAISSILCSILFLLLFRTFYKKKKK